MLRPGQKAPSFALEAMGGEKRSLDEFLASGPAVLAFFKISCPVCQFAFPFLERIHKAVNGSKLQFVGVSQDGAPATESFMKDQGMSFTTLLDTYDGGYEVSNAYGIRSVPTVIVVEQDGQVSSVMEGFDKAGIAELGARAGAEVYRAGEDVPPFRPG